MAGRPSVTGGVWHGGPMRILLVGDPDQPHTQRWAAGLAASGANVAMAGLGEDPGVGVPFHRLGSTEIHDARYLMALPALRKAIAAASPDVVHAHFVSSYGVLSALAAGARPVLQFAWGSDVLWHDRRSAWHRRLVAMTLAAAAVVVDPRRGDGGHEARTGRADRAHPLRAGGGLDHRGEERAPLDPQPEAAEALLQRRERRAGVRHVGGGH